MRRRRRRRWLTTGVALAVGLVAGALLVRWYWAADEPSTGEVVRSTVRVEVWNGCGVTGAAGRAASKLRRAGFRVESIGEADHYHYTGDVVVVRQGDRAEAARVAAALRGAVLVEQRIPGYAYDVTVIAGRPHALVEPD